MGYVSDGRTYDEFIEMRDGEKTFVVTEENIGRVDIIPVDILLPKKWSKKVEYRLEMDYDILGTFIPKNYVSDGASVPRWFWNVFPPVGRYLLAAFLHDWKLDSQHGWKDSNKAFDEAMKALQIKSWRHFTIINAVRLNGWFKSRFFGEPR